MKKSIDTLYNGNYFRSRLEARWAVFFDLMKIPYIYEEKGFITSSGCYLPDFYLPSLKVYAEVKPKVTLESNCNKWIKEHQDFNRWMALIKETNNSLLLLIGNPYDDYLPLITDVRVKIYEDGIEDWIYDPVYISGLDKMMDGKEYFTFLKECCVKANMKRFEHNN